MGITSAVHWWEEWQLRVLVLSSLVVQWLLFISAIKRKHLISYWSIRSFIWLAYLGSDAIAIYALAALFNRQRKQDYAAANNKSILELVWAPILLMHLGGQDCITAYNVEDNELWRRHVLTAVSQITVAIYVFWKSWPASGHKRLLQVSILAFVPGVLKCLEKPWALKSASINSLVSPDAKMLASCGEDEINSLEAYVQKPKKIVDADGHQLAEALQGRQGDVDGEGQAQGDEEDPSPPEARAQASRTPLPLPLPLGIRLPSQLFADLASPYPDRLVTLQSFWVLDKTEAYASLQIGIYGMFDLLYTKIKMIGDLLKSILEKRGRQRINSWQIFSIYLRIASYTLPFVAVCLLPSSHTKYYDENDVKVTYTLFYCTAALEYFSLYMNTIVQKSTLRHRKRAVSKRLPGMVSQYSLVGFFARNQRYSIMMCIVSWFQCKHLVDQLWCMKPCRSSAQIIELVIEHVKKGWKNEIHDVASYRRFNNLRGQWTLGVLNQQLGWSLRRPFDESVLLWHIATDVCFYTSAPHQDAASAPQHGLAAWCETSPHHETAVRCRQISQYMMYLMFVNPEMLLAGTRRNLFTAANAQLEAIFKGKNPYTKEMGIIDKLKSEQGSLSREQGGFFIDALALADALERSVDDEKKVWEVIEGVWVEMLCFSASRSRGYLHAKSLGSCEEFLTYVWLLLSHMGMETLPEMLQVAETDRLSMEGNTRAAPSFSRSLRTLRRTSSI